MGGGPRRLGPDEVYRKIKPVDIAPVLPILPTLPWFRANSSGAKYPCDVVMRSQFPSALAEVVSSLDLGGETARAMLRRLGPRQSIPPHVDDWMPEEMDWRRFQLPLTSDPTIVMRWTARWPLENVTVHLQPGWLYEVRYDTTHEVMHNADCSRVHLQIDQVGATI